MSGIVQAREPAGGVNRPMRNRELQFWSIDSKSMIRMPNWHLGMEISLQVGKCKFAIVKLV
ncbi:hypothetical protein PDENDC454_24625 [Paenibacillus dendritiformis C454]|uniref:Uncharacterized protein n=1 Tax=Paenibacillus dendritiformis C454 TaxID=1131935 RepID=H3SMX8_9BACL|nr:hypothetical protein PDENDC454_24625 [Paenibacillus dendritiformis C454]